MASYLSPIGNEQQSDPNGAPLSGGLIYTYQAGTTTAVATYTDSSGATPQANPIVLNTSGLPDSPIWLPAGQAVKLVIKDSNGVTQRTIDNVLGINDPAASTSFDQWVTFTSAPTYVSATSFTVGGDQTATFQASRRVKSTNTGGTVYSTVSSSSYNSGTARTTVTVANDSGSLDSGMSSVSYGLLSADNPSIPKIAISSGAVQATTSGTFKDFTGIPYGVKRVTLLFSGVSTSGTSALLVQLGTSGGVEATGYLGSGAVFDNTPTVLNASYTTGIGVSSGAAANAVHGSIVFEQVDAATFKWVARGNLSLSNAPVTLVTSGSKTLAGVLDRIRVTTAGGADTFDAGSVNVLYE